MALSLKMSTVPEFYLLRVLINCVCGGRGREHLLEIFKIQVDVIILPEVADRFLSIGWVPMS